MKTNKLKSLWQRLDKKALIITVIFMVGLIVLNILVIMFMGGVQ